MTSDSASTGHVVVDRERYIYRSDTTYGESENRIRGTIEDVNLALEYRSEI